VARRQSGYQVRQSLENFTLVVTGRWVVSLPSVTACLPFIFFFALERENGLDLGSFANQLMAVSAGVLVALLYLYFAQAIFLSTRRSRKQSLSISLFVWFSTGYIQGVVTDLYAHQVLNANSHAVTRLWSSFFTTGLSLALAAYWFGTINKIRNENSALKQLDQLLNVDSRELSATQIVAKDSARNHLKDALLPKISQMQDLALELKDSAPSATTQTTFDEIESQARNLYIEMESILQQIEKTELPDSDNRRIDLTQIKLMSGIFPKEISVTTSFIFLLLGAIISQGTRNGYMGALVGILSSLLIFLTLYILNISRLQITLLQRAWFTPVAYLTIFVVQYSYASLFQNGLFNLVNPYPPLYSSFKTLSGVYLASLVTTLFNIQNSYYSKLTSENLMIRSNLEGLSKSTYDLNELSESTVFGTINGKISGAIMALNMLKEDMTLSSTNQDLLQFLQRTKSLVSDSLREVRQIELKERSL
jgi:hypothetical protein